MLLGEPTSAPRPSASRSQVGQGRGVDDRASAAAQRRAQAIGPRPDPDAAEVESVRVPAGQDRRFAFGVSVAVQPHRFAELLEGHRRETGQNAILTKPNGEVRSTFAVSGIGPFIHTLAVVQECEPGENARIDIERACEFAAVSPNPTPVRDAVDAMMEVETELRSHDRERSMEDFLAGGVHGIVR